MNKKVIVSIVVFIFLGLFIWTFANPNEENKDQEPQQEGNITEEEQPVVEPDPVQTPVEVPAAVVPAVAPIVDNTQNDLNDANAITLTLTPSTTGPTRSVDVTLTVNTNRLDLIGNVNYGTNNACPNNNNLTLNGNTSTFNVTENGTYTICLLTTNGVNKTASIVINNITNTTALENAIEDAEKFEEPRNEELENALEEGKEVLENNEATQEEIDDATDKINDLIDALNITLDLTSNQTNEYTNQITINGKIIVPNNQNELIKSLKYGKNTCDTDLSFEDNQLTVVVTDNQDYHFCLVTTNNITIEKNINITMIDLIKPTITTDLLDNKISIRMNNADFKLNNLVSINKNDTFSDLNELEITSLFDITTKGTYEVKYNISDKVGNKADELTINVEVIDSSLLEDTVQKANNILVPINETLNEIYDNLIDAVEEAETIIEDNNSTQKEIDDATKKINDLLKELDDAERVIENNLTVSLTSSNSNWTNNNVDLTIGLSNEELVKDYKVVSGTSCDATGLTINNKKVNATIDGINTYTLCVTTKHDISKTDTETTKIDKTKPIITTNLTDNKISIRMNNNEFDLNNLVSANKNDTFSDLNKLEITSLFDITTKGTYVIKYNVSDKAGNNADELTINVEVTDVTSLEEAIEDGKAIAEPTTPELKENYDKLQDTIEDAEEIITDENSTQEEIDEATSKINDLINDLDDKEQELENTLTVSLTSSNSNWTNNNVDLTIGLSNEELVKDYKVVSGTSCDVTGLTINNKKITIETVGENTYTLCVTTKHDISKTDTETTKIDKTSPSITTNLTDNKISIRMNNADFKLNNLVSVNKNDTFSDLNDLVLTSLFDITTKGTYVIKYNVSDKAGNNADELTINVEVTDSSLLEDTVQKANNILVPINETLNEIYDNLIDAVEEAETIIEDNNSTQKEIDDATKKINDLLKELDDAERVIENNLTVSLTSSNSNWTNNNVDLTIGLSNEELVKDYKVVSGTSCDATGLTINNKKVTIETVGENTYTLCVTTKHDISKTDTETTKIDKTKPIITTNLTDNKISIRMNNNEFDLNNLVSVNKNDEYSDLNALVLTSLFDITTKGTYVIKYNVSDKAGNNADELTINVEVTDVTSLEEAIEDGEAIAEPTTPELKEIYDKLQDTIEDAEEIITDENSTQEEIDEATSKINDLINDLDDKEQELENTLTVSLTSSNSNWTNNNVDLTIGLSNEELVKDYKVVSGTSCDTTGLTINNKKVTIETVGENTYTLCVTTKHDVSKTASTTTKIDKTSPSITTNLTDNKISIRMNNNEFDLNNLVSVNKNDTYSNLNSLSISNNFNINVKSTYEVKYNVSDKAGNNADELTINVEVTDAILLNTAINNANSLYETYKNNEDLQTEVNALKIVIDNAKLVYNNINSTQKEIDDATASLNAAINTFNERIELYTTIIAINPSSNNDVYQRNASMNNIDIIATYKDNHTTIITDYLTIGTFDSRTVTTSPRSIKYTYNGLETTYYYTVVRSADDQTLVSLRATLDKITYNTGDSQGTLEVYAKDKDNTEYLVNDYQIITAFNSNLDFGTNEATRQIEVSYTKNGITKNASVSYKVTRPESERITGIIANVKANKQLAFTKNKNYNIKDYIDVYYVNRTGNIVGNALTNDQYRVENFSTNSVGTMTLKVISNYNNYNATLEYFVTTENVNQNKFQVRFMANKQYERCFSITGYDCIAHITETEKYNFLEIEENYLEGIKIEKVVIKYTNNKTQNLSISNSVRWTKYSYEIAGRLDPVYIGSINNKDVMDNSNVIKTVEITYKKEVKYNKYDKYVITFEYKNNEFVAISEIKQK